MNVRLTLAVALVLLVTGCTAPATQATSETPLAELALSPEGLGPLTIGQQPGAEQDVLVYSASVCQSAVDEGYRDEAAMWVANYEPAVHGFDSRPFGVLVEGDALQSVEVYDDSISTAEGIHIGSTAAEVLAAYGDRLELVEAYDEGSDSHLYRVEGVAGDLYIEVLKAETVDVHPEIGAELVLRLTASAKGRVPLGTNSDFVLGLCTQP